MTNRPRVRRILVPRKIVRLQLEKRPTRAVQIRRTGILAGRTDPKFIKLKRGDTRIMRLAKPYDVNKDGRMTKVDLKRGQIIGRTSEKSLESLPKRIPIQRHYRKNRNKLTSVRRHNRRR